MNNEAYIKKIKNAGKTIEIIGLFYLIYNIVFIFVLGPLFLIPLVITAVVGLVFLILGWMIRKNPGAAAKKLLWATTVISAILMAMTFSNMQSKGFGTSLIILVFVMSLVGIDAVRKLDNPALQQAEAQGQELRGKDRAKDILKMVGIAVVVLGGFLLISYVGYQMNH